MEKLKTLLMQAVKFGLVGVLNTAIDFVVYTLLVQIPFFAQYYLLAQVAGYGCGLGNSLYFNKRWTFAQKEKMAGRQLIAFVAVNLVALAVSSGVLYLAREGALLNLVGAKVIATVFSMGVNFVGNKLFVFNGKTSKK